MNKAFGMVLIVMALLGCAGTGKMATPDATAGISGDVEMQVSRANGLFEAGKYGEAERAYREFLDEYDSRGGAFETAVLTNLCLCHLETGERARFKDCAGKLREASRELDYLTRETQLVLELDSFLGSKGPKERDVRIESRITEGLTGVLGKEGE